MLLYRRLAVFMRRYESRYHTTVQSVIGEGAKCWMNESITICVRSARVLDYPIASNNLFTFIHCLHCIACVPVNHG